MPPAPGLVLNHDILTKPRSELFGNEARRNVGRPAGSETNHQPDRATGKRIGGTRRARRPEQGDDEDAAKARPE